MTHKLVLIRHGESQWNLENRFTGWTDVDLTDNGRQEAIRAGQLLKQEGYDFDLCYTSVLPPLAEDDPRLVEQLDNPRYAGVPRAELPRTECLKDTVARVLPFWNETIAPSIKSGKRVIIAAHGNSLRALVKHLDGISDDDIVELNIPTARPLVYELDDNLKPIRHYYLGNQAEIEAAMAAVAKQGSAKKG